MARERDAAARRRRHPARLPRVRRALGRHLRRDTPHVYVGYQPCYLGYYPYHGTVVYGTGYRYEPWRGTHPLLSAIRDVGFSRPLQPVGGTLELRLQLRPRVLAGRHRWRPDAGRVHERGDTPWFGPGGYRRPWLAFDRTLLRTPPPGGIRAPLAKGEPANLYTRPANAPRVNRNVLMIPWLKPARPAGRPTGTPNDAFAGKDGRVYRRDETGRWRVNERGNWKPTPTPTPALSPRSPLALRPAPPPPARTGRRFPEPVAARPAPPPPASAPSKPPPSGDLEGAFRARERARARARRCRFRRRRHRSGSPCGSRPGSPPASRRGNPLPGRRRPRASPRRCPRYGPRRRRRRPRPRRASRSAIRPGEGA